MQKTLDIQTPEWFVPFLSPARYKGIYGGRGGGKSQQVAEYLIEESYLRRLHVVCVREVQNSISQSVKKLLEESIEKFGLQHFFKVTNDNIKGENGSLFIFQGLKDKTSDSIKSLQSFDIAWVEEAQSISARSLDVLRPTIRKPGSEIWFTWNPESPDAPIESLRTNPPKDCLVKEINYYDNPWFPQELRDEMEYDKARDIDKYNHVWLGQFQNNSEARVFKNWRVEEFETPKDVHLRFGSDFGYSADPTVLVRCYLVDRRLYIDHEAYMHNCEIINIPELYGTIPESDLYPIIADSSRPETISYLRKNGYPRIFSSTKGPGSVKEGIEWLRSFDIIVHSRCNMTIKELTNYSYKVDPLTNEPTQKLKDDHNHIIDALRYACESVRKVEKEKKPVRLMPTVSHWN